MKFSFRHPSSFHPTQGNSKRAKTSNFTMRSSQMVHFPLVQSLSKAFASGCEVFQMDCCEVQPSLGSRPDFLFVARVAEINPSIFFASCNPQHFNLVVFPGFLVFLRLVQVLVLTRHGFPLWSFDSLKNVLAEGVPVLVNLGWHTIFISHIRGVDEGAQTTFFMCSHTELTRTFPSDSSREICREP